MKATISAEWIGKNEDDLLRQIGGPPIRRPWCARVELTRRGFDRHFINGKVSYCGANSKGSRGVLLWFVIESGHVYEIKRFTSWRASERVFLRVLLDGTVQEGTEKDAEQWLSDPSE